MLKNLPYILVLVLSIALLITLSLFKEGVFFSGDTKVSRCSALGVAVIIFISVYCVSVSLVCYQFVIKHEKKILMEKHLNLYLAKKKNIDYSVITGENPGNLRGFNTPRSSSNNIPRSNLNNVLRSNSNNVPITSLPLAAQNNYDKEFNFKRKQLIKLCCTCLIVGIGAGLLGIGGGMILIPILISMDFSPLDASAVTSMGVLITSTISTSEFLIMKAIKFSDLSYFLIFAGIGSIIGVFIIKKLIIMFKRQSMLLVVILGIFVIAIIVLPLFGFLVIPVKNYFQIGTLCL